MRLDLYRMAKALFWSLPGPIRERLHGVRHRVVRSWRTRRAARPLQSDLDLTWDEFRSQVLDCRSPEALVVVFEPTVDWGVTLFQRPQHMAAALGRKGCIVLYRTTGDGVGGVRKAAPNVWLVGTSAIKTVREAVWSFYSTASLCSPDQMEDRRRRGRVVYEYIDHIDSAISGSATEINRLLALKTAACSGMADYLVASSRALFAELGESGGSAPIAYIPNGVDVAHFRDPRHAERPLPPRFLEFRGRFRKVVGYYGAIAPWLWFDLLAQVADQLEDVGFVYIGPDYGGCAGRLPKRGNVLYLGPVDYVVLPGFALQFDVCFIPFSPGVIAQTTSPLKLFEYFALEKPVVVTADMGECTVFPEVFAGSDLPTFIEALEKAFVASSSLTYRQSILQLAYSNTWDARADTFVNLIRRNRR